MTAIQAPGAVRVGLWKRLGSRRAMWFTIIDFTLLFVIWQVAVGQLKLVNEVFLPAPTSIVAGYGQLAVAGTLWDNMAFSAITWVIGFTLGALVGVASGLFVGSLHVAYKLIMPLMWAAWATPIIAIQPIIGVWFGFGMLPNVVLVFISAAIPIALNTVAGVTGVNPSLMRASRVYGASKLQTYLKVRLPWTIPYIFGGFRLAVPTSLIGLLVGEMITSPNGMGSIIIVSLSRYKTNQAFSAIFFYIIVAVVLVFLAERLERRVSRWREVSAR